MSPEFSSAVTLIWSKEFLNTKLSDKSVTREVHWNYGQIAIIKGVMLKNHFDKIKTNSNSGFLFSELVVGSGEQQDIIIIVLKTRYVHTIARSCPRPDVDPGSEMDLAAKTRFTEAAKIGLQRTARQLHWWKSHRTLQFKPRSSFFEKFVFWSTF
jgi:hypothetical protein